MKKEMKPVYTSDDGVDFFDEYECRQYERQVALTEIIETWTVHDYHITDLRKLVRAILAWVDKAED